MPAEIAAAAVGAGGSFLGTIGNYIQNRENMDFQEKQNRKSFEEEVALMDRSHNYAVEDWNRNNQYNSPEQQMRRLVEAGLNPSLVYGKGADATAAPIRGGSSPSVNRAAPQSKMDYSSEIMRMFNAALMPLQINLQQQALETARVQTELEKAKVSNTKNLTAQGEWLLNFNKNTESAQARALMLKTLEQEAGIKYTQAQTGLSLTMQETEKLMQTPRRDLMLQDILYKKEETLRVRLSNAKNGLERERLQAEIDNIRAMSEKIHIEVQKSSTENRILELDEKLKKDGIQPHDALWQRKITQEIQKLLNSTPLDRAQWSAKNFYGIK